MAVVGEARVMIRTITPPNPFRNLENQSRALDRIGLRAGSRLADSFKRGFASLPSGTLLGNVARGIRQIGVEGEGASRAFSNLQRFGQVLSPILGGLAGAIGALVGGLGALIGNAAGAAASLASLGSAGFAAVAGLTAARLALSGVGRALGQLNRQGGGGGGGGGGASNNAALAAAREAALRRVQDAEANLALTIERNRESLLEANERVRDAQLDLNRALQEGREEIQQLGFDAEDAALSEERAALELEDARRALAAAQDLPPNSRVRQEAELAYREAELNYRKAKDSAADLAAEQERLARTGVAGTQGVIDATEALAEAEADRERTVRDNLRAQADAERDLADAKKAAAKANDEIASGGGGGGGGVDPFAGLNAAQIEFVKNLQTLKPELEELKRVTAEALLPNLWIAIKTLMDDTGDVFPVLRDGLEDVAFGLGLAAIGFANAVAEGNNLKDLAGSFAQSGTLIETFGRVAGEAWGVMITLINEAFPIAQRFFGFLEEKLGAFDAWLDTTEGRSTLRDFFQRSADAMAQWGSIFGNIFAGFGAIINANLGPGTGGQLLLDWLEEATAKFAALDDTASDANALNEYFVGAAENMKSMFQSIGALLGEIIKLGDMPEIKETWDTLAEGADEVGRILGEAIKVGPAFADVILLVTEITDLLVNAETGLAFFGTLRAVLEPLRDFLANDMVQAFLDWLAPITGVALAVGGIVLAFQVGIPIILGYAMRIIQPFITLGTVLLNHPILLVLAAITGAIIYLWNTSETFRDSMIEVFESISGAVLDSFGAIASTLAGVIPPLIESLSTAFLAIMPAIEVVLVGLAQAFGTIITAVLPLVTTLLVQLIPAITGIIQAVLPLIVMLVQQLAPVIATIATFVAGVLAQALTLVTTVFTQLFTAIMPLVLMLIEQLVPVIMQIVQTVVPPLIEIFNQLIPVIMSLIEAFMPMVTMLLEAVIPVVEMLFNTIAPLISQIAELLIPIIEAVIEVFMELMPPIMELVQALISALMPIFKIVVDFIKGFLVPIIEGLILVFKNFLIPIIMNVVGSVRDFLLPIIKGITETLKGVIDFLVGVFTGNWERAWNGLVGIFRGIANTIISVFEGMINFVVDGINGFLGSLNAVGDWVADISGGAVDINVGTVGRVSLPRLAKGGTVMATPGGIMAVIGEAGQNERIEPLDKDGLSKRDYAMIEALVGQNGGGVNITVVQNPGENMEAFAQRVSEIIAGKMRRGMA